MPTTRSGRSYTTVLSSIATPISNTVRSSKIAESSLSKGSVTSVDHERFPSDLDGRIAWCRRKIQAGIEVEENGEFLADLLEIKAKFPSRDITEGEPDGLPYAVYKRIDTLKRICETIVPESPERTNADAVLAAYRSGGLTVETGKVSYWVDGKQISGLKKLDTADVIKVADANGADKGRFWLEDLRPVYAVSVIASNVLT